MSQHDLRTDAVPIFVLVMLVSLPALAGTEPKPATEATPAGRVTRKVAPRPSLFSAAIRPPCASTIERAMDSPTPIPS